MPDPRPLGAPYFVMEYVSGVPIATHCDNHRLSTRQHLELFVHVCEGVQHAHQKAIIDRDLKLSNILVTEVDGRPVPKIIDFGVAKALTQKLTDIKQDFGAWR
jgi:eukaryotic-like serine/threonine-protein kinase